MDNFYIAADKDKSPIIVTLWVLTLGIAFGGGIIEWLWLKGALVASMGVIVAVTTPIFAKTISQVSDSSTSVRIQLYAFRLDRASAKNFMPVAFDAVGQQKEEDALTKLEAKIAEFVEHQISLNLDSSRLVRTQSGVVATAAMIASFGGYLMSYLNFGCLEC